MDTSLEQQVTDFALVERSLEIFRIEFGSWTWTIQTTFYLIMVAVGICAKGMIIRYILFHTPKDRPLDRLLLANQVGKCISLMNNLRLLTFPSRSRS